MAIPLPPLWSRVLEVEPDECWFWLGPVSRGYGRHGARVAHRVTYEARRGPIPEGLDLDHLCRVRHCVNPAHLEPVTRQENIRRGLHGVLRTHCPHGHPYDEANTHLLQPQGWRVCRACSRAAVGRYQARKQARS